MVMRWESDGITTTEIPYVYDGRNRLISYNGQTIAYDDFGNPLNWRNLTNLNYKHRRLISCTAGADQLQYAYNGNGMRVSKTVNGVETERYYYQGNNLVGIWRKAGNHMQFVYDQTGVCGTWYNGQLYSFTKNVFGDFAKESKIAFIFIQKNKYDKSTDFNNNKMQYNIQEIIIREKNIDERKNKMDYKTVTIFFKDVE